jgi:hypothetical protein
MDNKRRGLILAIDLDEYDWAPEARPLIRATEGTVRERLPPRMKIRRKAPLEISHVLLLIDDEEDTLIPSLAKEAMKNPPLYNTTLRMDSGSVAGWALNTEAAWVKLAEGLENLAQKAATRYGTEDKGRHNNRQPFLFAVGDGNHSLATAKGIWEEYKAANPSEPGLADHPCRYAMVELENLHDPGISFKPIHRVLFDAEPGAILELLSRLPGFSSEAFKGNKGDFMRAIEEPLDNPGEKSYFGLVSQTEQHGKRNVDLTLIKTDVQGIAAASLQPLLDDLISRSGDTISIDYIHGEGELIRIVSDSSRRAAGIILPPVQKHGFFKTIAQHGPLPRKSFSMGEAVEKRFYLECRRLSQI